MAQHVSTTTTPLVSVRTEALTRSAVGNTTAERNREETQKVERKDRINKPSATRQVQGAADLRRPVDGNVAWHLRELCDVREALTTCLLQVAARTDGPHARVGIGTSPSANIR